MAPIDLNILEIEAILDEQETKQKSIMLARNYFNGVQDVYLNDRAREYLGLHKDNAFKYNICRTIVNALSEELTLLGFSTDESEEDGASRPVAEWAADLFEANKLDSLQDTIHEGSFSDSVSFVIVEWDPRKGRSKIIHNPYYIDPNAGGDGMGAYIIYENDDPDQEPIVAVKRWIETLRPENGVGPSLSRLRATLYFPDHFERWVYDDSGTWRHFIEDTGERDEAGDPISIDWYIDNTDSTGEPLGIPVFDFRNKGDRPEHWDSIPMQDSINKTLVDVLAAGDLTAFQSFFGFGFYPTTDGKSPNADGTNLMKMGPAQFNGTTKPASEASLQVIPGQDSTFLMNQFKDLILSTAQQSSTPANRFVVTAAIASDKTIKEQEKGLKKKAKKRRGLFSDPWVGVFNMARKLDNLYGGKELSEEIVLVPVWEHLESLDELAEKKAALEIPIEELWREAGYTESQIETMKEDPSYKVKFETALWQGVNAASLAGIPIDLYLERVGIPEEEIKIIMKRIREQSGVPTEEL